MANIKKLPLFCRCVIQNFPFIEEDFDALTNYELICKVVEYLNKVIASQNEVISVANNLQESFQQLHDYVENYFDNLDVQEEINNKLDEMAEDGTLQEIITAYIQANVAWEFNTVAEMKQAENFINGSFAHTLGYFAANDGGAAYYRIRNITNDDTIDESTIIEITGDPQNQLVGELIFTDEMNLTQFGINHTESDVSIKLNHVVNVCSTKGIELIIPAHTYNLQTPTTKSADSYTYAYFVETLTGTKIKGADKEKSILKIPNGSVSYTSVFFNDEDIADVELSNFTIEQYYLSGATITPANRDNNKNAFVLYGKGENINIHDIYFKNCCGVDVISFHDNTSSNIVIADNIFDYYHVQGIAYYDRSIIYMECNNYVVKGNILHGNFETLGGIECHGYKGLCKDNVIEKCNVAIHIAPKYDDTVNGADIIVADNIMNDNAQGIRLWYNTSSTATKGCRGVNISNNDIRIAGSVYAQTFWTSTGLTVAKYVGGIMPAPTSEDKPWKDVIIDKNTIVLTDYANYTSYTSANLNQFSGINLWGRNSLTNIHITNNVIEGIAGNAIVFGDTRSSATTFSTHTNILVEGNSILNCGYGTQSENSFKAYIHISRGNMNNVIVRNNIMTKTDGSYNTTYAVLNQGAADMTKKNVYYTNNIISSVISASNETRVTNSSGYYTLITDRGDTTNRPTTANVGDRYFDTTLGKMIVYNGSAWVNVNGTSL